MKRSRGIAFSVLGGGNFTGVFISADSVAYTNEAIVGKRSVSVYNSSGYTGLITSVYINGLDGLSDLNAVICANDTLTSSVTENKTIGIVSDTVTPL